jgi:hypothetical protein
VKACWNYNGNLLAIYATQVGSTEPPGTRQVSVARLESRRKAKYIDRRRS